MNLFALTNNPKKRIIRFKLDAALQPVLNDFFLAQVERFSGLNEEIEFDGRYKPEDNEVLYIDKFNDPDNLISAVKQPLTVEEASGDEFDSVRAVFFGLLKDGGDPVIYIQHFDRRRLISPKGFSIYHAFDHVYKRLEGAGLTLDNKIAASLEGRKLKFTSFFHLRQIFDVADYFMEATDGDIQEFVALPQFSVVDAQQVTEASDQWIRKKIWLVKNSEILNSVPVDDILASAMEFGIVLKSEDDNGVKKIVLPQTRAELKILLRFLDEDYYKSSLSNKNFISNSKRQI